MPPTPCHPEEHGLSRCEVQKHPRLPRVDCAGKDDTDGHTDRYSSSRGVTLE